MRVYVDAPIHRWRGRLWCHMFSPDLDALHHLAARIGMRKEWFQDPAISDVAWCHYDVHKDRREVAVRLGAIELNRHQTVVMSRVIIASRSGSAGLDPFGFNRAQGSRHLPQLQEWLARELELLPNIAAFG